MKGKTIRVLLIEDNIVDALFVEESLAGTSDPVFVVHKADQLASGLARLEAGGVDALLLDLCLPDSEGLATFRRAQATGPGMPIVVLSGDTDEEIAVEAVQAGAQDYLVKGHYNRDLLTRSLRYAIERKRTQQALSELAQRLTHHVSNSPLAVIEWGTNLDIIRWSGEAEHIFGWKPEEVLGRSCHDFRLIYTDDERKVTKVFADLCAGAPKNFSANRNYRKDGSVIHCDWYNSSLMDGSGRIRSILSLALDVTEQRQAEEALNLANQQLRQLTLDLLHSQDYERRRIARELHDSTSQVLAALSINLSRLQNSEIGLPRKQALLAESIDLAAASSREIRTVTYLLHPPLLDEVGLVSALQTYAEGFEQRTGVHIELNIPPDFGRLDGAAEMALFRIVQEGLGNVHRHSGSPVAIIVVERDATDVRLVLQDRGCGLSAKAKSQGKESVRFGVGLLGMRERVEQLGGELEIASTEAGTRLNVRLRSEKTMDKLRILVVDDHQLVRKGVVAAIEDGRPDWEVCGEASNGREAVAAAERLDPDIVVMDISMPDMSGLEATRQIVKANSKRRVLIVSMHQSEQIVRDVLDSGARGYILKSDAGTELMGALESLQHNKPFFTSKIAEVLLRGYLDGPTSDKALPPSPVSHREREIIQLVAEGKSNKEVANTLNISPKTVETHRARIMAKLDLHSISDLVRYAIRNGITEC
ncbi:MAG TPA: response regulator [Bryobacteraceae bacterium]|jgi:PAS domain S-box-containing protein|nr:response regulator [Bryobacteraceae bacterium]